MNVQIIPLLKIIVTSFVSVFIIINFMDRICKRKMVVKRTYIVAFILSLLLFIISAIIANPIISITITIAVIFGNAFFLYDAKKSSDILILCLFLIFLMLTEIIGQIVVSFISVGPVSISHGDLMQSTITFTCYQLVMYFVTSRMQEFNSAGNLITLVVIPTISLFQMFILLYLLKDQTDYSSKLLVLFGTLLIFVINIIIYILFNRISMLNYEKSQYQLLEQQQKAQYKYFNELEQNYEESRKFFHDIKNHLNIIEELYKNEKTVSATYAESLRCEMDKLDVPIPSSNRIINILIYNWLPKAEKHGITFSYQCEDIDLSFISDKDLATILSNIFDNAFEECLTNQCTNNFIDFNVCKINNFVVISLTNSCHSKIIYASDKLISGKENHLGLGLENVRKTVMNYHGIMDINNDNQTFTIQLTFFGQD